MKQVYRTTIAFFLCLWMIEDAVAQGAEHPMSEQYQWPADPLVRRKLEDWQDKKFGMIIHWGIYAVPGIIESWSICSEDWISRDSTIAYEDYKKWYWGLSKQFNPVQFDPDQWAKAGKDAGMKYLVFTTKHHDGFAMFDTKQSDFSIAKGPFAKDPRRDVARYVFDAFRKQGFMIGAYFSKPDWHSPYYWWPKYATANRNNNYDIRTYPWRWNQFKSFTHAQVGELMQHYGTIDILWLDGGWVRPRETINQEVLSWGAPIPDWSQDIDIPSLAKESRKTQPGLLVVDRTVHGEYENYQTPEQRIPAKKIDNPWESCITLGNAWSYVANDRLKSAREIIHKLVEIVAKGGNLLLGVGPTPDGRIPANVVDRLREIGDWLRANGASIYNTRTTSVYNDGSTWFTRNEPSKTMYAISLVNGSSPATVEWRGNIPAANTKVILLSTGMAVPWQLEDGKVIVSVPPGNEKIALAFSYQTKD